MLFFGNIFDDFMSKSIHNLKNQNSFLILPDNLKEKINHLLLEKKDNKLRDMLIYYFESYFENYYFKKIEDNEKDEKRLYQKILIEDTSDIIANILNYSDKNDILNLDLLCGIGFIKIYFKYFVDIMYKLKNGNEYIDLDELIKNKIFIKIGKLDIISEIKNNLAAKCKKDNYNLEQFIKEYNISYLNEVYNKDEIQKKFVIYNIPNYVPNKQILKEKFKPNKNEYEVNTKKYPLLNQLLFNEQNIKYLNNLPIIVYITNKMLDIYSYRKTSQEIKETKIVEDEINLMKKKIKDFEINMKKYIKSYNNLCDIKLGKSCFSDENYMNKSVELFLINKNNDNNQLNYILNNFISFQNDFIFKISEKYFINNDIKEINVQEATEENVIRFCSSDDEFLSIFMNNTLMKNKNQYDILEFDLEEIENDLAEKIIPGLKKFVVGKIKTMKYKGDDTDEIINYFKSKYKPEKLIKDQQDYIIGF